jgi:hypothetical protein
MAFETYARRQAKALFDELSDRLLKDLSKAAQEEADERAGKARLEAERAAQSAVAAARAEGEARLASAQAMNTGLLESVEAAQREVQALKATAKAESDRARQQVAALEARVEQLQQERKEILRSRDEAATRHEGELKRAKDLAHRLDTEAKRARELNERLEAESQRGTDLAGRLEAELRRGSDLAGRLEAEMRRGTELAERLKTESRRAGQTGKALEVASQDREAMIERVGAALQCIDRASTPSEILETLLDPLARDFAVAAVFLVGASHVRGWQARGLDSGTDITKLVIPNATESPVTRAVAEQKRVLITASAEKPATGVWGTPVARAVALPVLANGRVVAVAYAEDAEPPHTSSFPGAGCQIVEILIEHAALRLTTRNQPAPAAQPEQARDKGFVPARQARRLKKQEGLDLTVDGAETSLVDVSSTGAQIVSPAAMRPNRVLRMMLRAGGRALECKGRVMWARFEQARGTAAAHYRVGVKFTDVDQKTVEAFLTGVGVPQTAR